MCFHDTFKLIQDHIALEATDVNLLPIFCSCPLSLLTPELVKVYQVFELVKNYIYILISKTVFIWTGGFCALTLMKKLKCCKQNQVPEGSVSFLSRSTTNVKCHYLKGNRRIKEMNKLTRFHVVSSSLLKKITQQDPIAIHSLHPHQV